MTPDTIHNLLARLEADDRELLHWLAPHLSDKILHEIAECDYGFDFDLNLDRLLQIRDSAEVPRPLEWNPKEVLELTRWLDPRGREPRPSAEAAGDRPSRDEERRADLKRLFACAALVRAGSDAETFPRIMGENSTLASLTDSASALGDGATRAAIRLLAFAAGAETRRASDQRVFFALAIIMLSVVVTELAEDESLLTALLDWVEYERTVHWMNEEFGGYSILELESSTRDATWRALAREILIDPFAGTDEFCAADGRFRSARPPWRTCSVADRLVTLGRSITEARTE